MRLFSIPVHGQISMLARSSRCKTIAIFVIAMAKKAYSAWITAALPAASRMCNAFLQRGKDECREKENRMDSEEGEQVCETGFAKHDAARADVFDSQGSVAIRFLITPRERMQRSVCFVSWSRCVDSRADYAKTSCAA